MADKDDQAGQGSGPPDGRRRRPPPTIEAKAVEMPTENAAASETPSPEAPASSPAAPAAESNPEPRAAPSSVPRVAPAAPRARTPWFPVLAAGTLGAGLALLAAGAAWVYLGPLDERDVSDLSARVARLELQKQSAAEVAEATVPDLGKVPAAKVEELAARLTKLESASAASAPQAGKGDSAEIEDLSARISRLESAPAAPDAKAEAAEIKELSARLGRAEGALGALPAPDASDSKLAGQLAAIETAIKPLAAQVADLEKRSGESATTAREAREHADAVAKAMADVNQADADQDKRQQGAQAEVADLKSRFGAIETELKGIRDQVAESAAPKSDEPLRFAVVAAGLRSALERGEPFTAELAAAKAVGTDPAVLAEIAPFAATGIPNPQDLFRDLGGLIPEMLKVSAPAAQDGSYLDRLQAHAEKLVRIRPVGDRPGDDAATVIGRIERDMARRDLPAVLAELDKLPAPAQAIAEPWRKKALARQAAATVSAKLVAASFAKLGASASVTKQ
jgi:hypothetical protein